MGKGIGLVNNGNRSSTDKVLKRRLKEKKEEEEKIAVKVRRESEERKVRKERERERERFWPVAPIQRVPAGVRESEPETATGCVFTGDCIQW